MTIDNILNMKFNIQLVANDDIGKFYEFISDSKQKLFDLFTTDAINR